MESESREIITTRKTQTDLNSDNTNTNNEIKLDMTPTEKSKKFDFKDILSTQPNISEENLPNKIPVNLNYTKSNCFSKLFFYWPHNIFKLANKGNLKHEDICHLSPEQSINYEIDKFKSMFLKYNSSRFKRNALILSIFCTNYKLMIVLFFLDLINVGLDYARMFFYRQVISIFSKSIFFPKRENFSIKEFFKNIENFQFNIVEAVFFYLIFKFIGTIIINHIEFNNYKLSCKVTNQMIAFVTEKIIKSNSFYKTGSVISEGELLNLAEVDAERIGSSFFSGPRIITAPIKVIISMILLFKLFGFYFLYVLIVLLIIIMIICFLQICYIKNLKNLLLFKDKRMKIVNYVFHTLKCLKLNGLDDEFINRIRDKREDELKYKNNLDFIDMVIYIINSNLNLILVILTLIFFAYSNKDIEISSLFLAFQLIYRMTFPLILIPYFFNRLFSNLLSVRRIQNFLNTENYEFGKYRNNNEYNKNVLIKFENVSFGIHSTQMKNKYNKKTKRRIFNLGKNNISSSAIYPISIELSEIKSDTKIKSKPKITIIDESEKVLLNDIYFSIKKSEFVAILGSTGAGKSSLINAILNNYQIYMKDSRPIINGEISYCSQQPWITTDTIKNNILFHNPYKEEKYNKILGLCQLERDMENFDKKDETIINSSTSNLSGGQKARIALARCLYKDADLYLFDDPFSSIDNSVSQAIFENSFCKYLKDKARIIVTNDVTNLIHVDKIIYMKKGSIVFTGPFEEYKKLYPNNNLALDIIAKERIKSDDSSDSDYTIEDEERKVRYYKRLNKKFHRNIKEEIHKNPYINKYFQSNKGKGVSWRTYVEYIKLQGGFIIFVILLILIIISKIIELYRRVFIPSLTKNYNELNNNNNKDEKIATEFSSKLKKNLPWFIKITLMGFLVNLLTEIIIDITSIKSMRSIHEQMIYKLVKAPINIFHDIIPIGQIINHLTKDIDLVQDIVPRFNNFFKLFLSLISSIGLCYIYNKATLCFCPFIILSSFYLTKSYLKTGRALTRLFRMSFAPIMTILNESIKGVDIIRTSHAERHTLEKMYQKLDERYGISLYSDGCLRWYNLRRAICSQIFFGAILCYMVYYSKDYSAKSIAIILQTTEEFINLLVNASTYLTQLEISMIGLERCKSLMTIETEKNPEKDKTAELQKKNWPNSGKIQFINYFTSYRPETPIILKNINLEIKPGEKVGIVGRTGSGKSSIVLCLSRILEPKNGKLLIDDEDINLINLEYLRDKLSIVAQEPFLIESNVRDNIDPLHRYSDQEILSVINDFCLFKKMGNEKLDLKIKENGKNLSLGEKQLISFARAVIKKNKIVILDEATSSLDIVTEKIIQNNLHKYLHNSTVIMIAHHLQMVKECEKIIVMENGEIVESGRYNDLLKNKNSKFYSLYIREEEI